MMKERETYSKNGSLKRAVVLAKETEDSGMETLQNLQQQSETISRIESSADTISNNLTVTDRILTQMSSFTRFILSPFSSSSTSKSDQKHATLSNQSRTTATGQRLRASSVPLSTQQGQLSPSAAQHQQEDDFATLSHTLHNLKSMAGEMGQELDHQNARLEEVGSSVDRSHARMKTQRKRMDRIR
eukprot:GCRY01002181.1.p1 GENE.GCRY01002181.1~~GCRY01002181.1.p1  ORF type:complete len:186 (+),score=16.72 GCRY01002181.1:129-686(+)